jgi:hypothetical protein
VDSTIVVDIKDKTGRYLDRRNQNPIDCSQTIWVIATNALDNIILDHCKVHREDLLESENPLQQQQSAAVLSGLLKRQLKTEFGVRTFPIY